MIGLQLRHAVADDARRVLHWANDAATRAASFNSAPIPWEDHEPWFADSLARPDRHLFIASLVAADMPGKAMPCALLRLQADAERPTHAEVGINVAPEVRGNGVGKLALHALTETAQHLGFEQLLASIRPDNPASIRTFAAVGYTPIADGEIDGQPALRFILDLTQLAAPVADTAPQGPDA